MKQAVTDGLSMKSVEPAEMRRRSLELHLVGLSSSADKENLRRFIDGWAVKKKYTCFLSHYKREAGAEARILKSELVRALKVPMDQVFLDADDLTDLRDLLECVRQSDVFILMWTDGVLSRPWCLAELSAAADAGIPILVVKINNSYSAPVTKINDILRDLPAYLQDKNATALDDLKSEKIAMDPQQISETIKTAITNVKSKADLTFDPNQSSVMLQSQICALAGAMVEVSCPENEALLPDLAPQEVEPWIVSRPIAIYIVFAEQDPLMKKLAEDVKDWLCRRCDLASDSIGLCSDSSAGRSIGDATPGDCDDVATNVDTVLLLQSEQVLAEPRSLARLYAAVVNGAPIVPVYLTSSKQENESKLWNFETSKLKLKHLGHLSSADASSVAAASGASAPQVGKVLSQVIPNVISKPLEIEGAGTQFEAQMLDIQQSLRREMAAGTAATGGKTTATEGVPPAKQVRVKARVVKP